MIKIAFYAVITLVAVVLSALFIFRNKSYHHFMIQQSNMFDEEYDRIYNIRN
jgi:hypothetical protein